MGQRKHDGYVQCTACEQVLSTEAAFVRHALFRHSRVVKRQVDHGTERGYSQHRRWGVPFPDDDACGCKAGHARYMRRVRYG